MAFESLSDKLQNIAMRLDMCERKLLSAEVDWPGDWMRQAALTRTEPGSFFALGGHPDCVQVMDRPWEISVVHAADRITQNIADVDDQSTKDTPDVTKMSAALNFRYIHESATKIPSKLTATQLKGRELDTEVADGSGDNIFVTFR
jgi:ATP-dependent helicase/nuclease subunit A